jgi:hypothetical protein
MRAPSGSRPSSAALIALALLLSACPAERATPGPTPTGSSGAVPRGTARVAVPDEPPTLNPLSTLGLSAETRAFLPLLTPVVGGSRTGPGTVHVTSEPGSLTFTVTPGSFWSDGTPITGRDIERTWRLVRAADIPFEGYEDVTAIRLVGDKVRVTPPASGLANGFRILPPDFTPEAYADAWPTSGGPFVLKDWTRGLEMRFAANPRSPGGAPELAGLHVSFVTDPDAALALFRRLEIDVLTRYGAPGWLERLAAAGAKVSGPGAGVAVAVVLRAPATAAARTGMLARIDVGRIVDVLVQEEAAFSCVARDLPPCDRNASLGRPGPKIGTLTLAYSASDALAYEIATALRQMLGPVRLQPRTAADLWASLDEIDLALLTGLGRDDLTSLEAAAKGPQPRVHTLFVARAPLAARIELPAPGLAGPFDGAGSWPSAVAPA